MSKAPIKELLFGRLALAGRLVTEEQIADCLELQRRYEEQGGPVPRLGELLAMKGYMTADQVKAVLEGQHSRREGLFGEIALRWRLLTAQDLEAALETQRAQDRVGKHRSRLGEILVEKGLLRPHQVRAILDAQGKRIIHCSGCNARFNVAQFRAGARLVCAKCGATTVLGETERHVADHSPLDVQNTVWISEAELAKVAEATGSGVFPGAGDESGTGSGLQTALQIGGFEILSRLGSDGVSNLCKARSLSTGDLVTIKVMRSRGAVDEKFLAGFQENSKGAVYLDHPNLKRVYEVGADRGRYFVAEEYVEGRSLKRHLETVGRMSPAEAVDCACQLAEALAYGHGRGIVHGDVRPSNVVIDRKGQARLSGLGVAKDAVLTLHYLGKDAPSTPFYLAPEAAVDTAKVDARSDVYSLGACLYHMLTGRPPYVGQGSLEVLMRLTQENPVPPGQIVPDLPQALTGLVMQMLSAEPDERPQTVAEVLARLRQLAPKLGPVKPLIAESTGTSLGTGLGTGAGTRAGTGTGTAGRPGRPPAGPRPAQPSRHAPQHSASGGSAAMSVFVVLVVLGVAAGGVWLFMNSRIGPPAPQGRPAAQRPAPVPAQPPAEPQADPAARLYSEAITFAEKNAGDDKVIAARFKAIVDAHPGSIYGSRYARDRYVKHLGMAGNRALDELARSRTAEEKGDFTAGLAALAAWRKEFADAPDEVRERGRRMEGTILAAQETYVARRLKEAETLSVAGRHGEAKEALARLGAGLTPEGAAAVAAKLKEVSDREIASADAATRQRLEEEKRKREEAERLAREERARQLVERLARLRPEVAELIGRRDFDGARDLVAAARRDAAGTEGAAAVEETGEVLELCASFHGAAIKAINAGKIQALIRFDGKPKQAVAADARTVTLDLGNNVQPKLPWDRFEGRDICEMARVFVPRDDGKLALAYAVYAAAQGQDGEAQRFLDLAAKGGAESAAARAAIDRGWLLTEKERRARADEAVRLAERAEKLRGEAAAVVAEWNLPKAAELFAAARRELAGTSAEAPLAQAEEALGLLAGFHGGFVAALKARKNNPAVKYQNRPRPVADAGTTGVTLDVEGVPARLQWAAIPATDLAWLALNNSDQQDANSLAGCALFLDLAGARNKALETMALAEKAGLRSAAPRAVLAARTLLSAEERKRRDDEERALAERFEKLRGAAAILAAGGDYDKAAQGLAAARAELSGTPYDARRAQIEEALGLAGAFNRVFMAGLKKAQAGAKMRYAGQPRRVTAGDAAGVTLDVEGSATRLAWGVFPPRDVCALARTYLDSKDGPMLLGYALFCSARGEVEEAARSLAAAEKLEARSPAARAVIENQWLLPPKQ